MAHSRAPLLFAIVLLLLLPVLYVGSYLALVQPASLGSSSTDQLGDPHYRLAFYRIGSGRARWLFWPLEQLDRRVRSELWQPSGPKQSPLD